MKNTMMLTPFIAVTGYSLVLTESEACPDGTLRNEMLQILDSTSDNVPVYLTTGILDQVAEQVRTLNLYQTFGGENRSKPVCLFSW